MTNATMIPEVDNYLAQGCGRCPLVATPECKVNTWREELTYLRPIMLDCGLTEELKWSFPCYTYNGNNVLLMSAFKEYCALSFFKSALMNDPDDVLFQTTENSQAVRLIQFTSLDQVIEMEPIVRKYIQNAIEVEEAGLEVEYKSTEEFDFPDELRQMMDEMPEFEDAFYALTPGRQRGYLLYFSGAKQSKTRTSRIEKHMQRIFDGKGLHDRD